VIHYSVTYADQGLSAESGGHRPHAPGADAAIPPHRLPLGHSRRGHRGAGTAGDIGRNVGKIGICWIGGLERRSGPRVGVNTMTPAQEASLIRLIRDLLDRSAGKGRRASGSRADALPRLAVWPPVSGAPSPPQHGDDHDHRLDRRDDRPGRQHRDQHPGALLVYALERYLKTRLNAAAREKLDSAMRNGADWLIRERRLPRAQEVMEYVRRAAPDAVARWKLAGANRELTEAGALAVIARAAREAN
jgi:hypothetical protein